jgi:flagellar hook-length control protein FliK
LLQGQRHTGGQRAELGTISGAALAAGAAPAAALAASAATGGDSAGFSAVNQLNLNAAAAPAAQPAPAAGSDAVRLAGTPEQWQQPLRDALGDRLQLSLQRNNDHAMIRLEPPNMGTVEISIRHSAGALQVNLSASNSEVLRQLNNIGDSVRQDLSQRSLGDVAVTVSASPRGGNPSLADGGSGRQQGQEQQQRAPGRALGDDEQAAATFAMTTERE